MKILHQLGHNSKWGLDAFEENEIGDGFVFGAFNITKEKLLDKHSKMQSLVSVDLQYYGSKSSKGLGKFASYEFHPALSNQSDNTMTDGMLNIYNAIDFQVEMGFQKVIIPCSYQDRNSKNLIGIIKAANKYISDNRVPNVKYYMSLVLSEYMIREDQIINELLVKLTNLNIEFDGYYVVCEPVLGYKQKVSVDFDYLSNLLKIFKVLKKQGFETIFGYANWDALIFLACTDIDYVTIGTYENLRMFNHARYSQKGAGGPSEGWYFSEKLINFIRAREIIKIRRNDCISIIKNEENVFSDVILNRDFIWNTHKSEVHKNYLIAISKFLIELANIDNLNDRIDYMISRIELAQYNYSQLANKKVFLTDESDDYFLGTWFSFLRSQKE